MLEIILNVIKHDNYQLSRVYPARFIGKKWLLTTNICEHTSSTFSTSGGVDRGLNCVKLGTNLLQAKIWSDISNVSAGYLDEIAPNSILGDKNFTVC